MENVDLDNKFKILQQKIENDKTNQNEDIKKLLESLRNQFNAIKIKAKADWEYSNQLLEKIEKDYFRDKAKANIDDTYKVCRGIIDSVAEKYIKYEKSIIVIVENYKSLLTN